MSNSPQPVVRGALRQTPLAEFLIQAYDSKLEGTLLLQTPTREKSAVLFVRGAPAKARPANNQVFLGQVATDFGLISAEVAASTLKKAQAEGKPHGIVLREEGRLDETGVYLALREQLKRQVLALCDLPDGTGFGFYRANYLADWGPSGEWRVKPLPMIWRALADHMPSARRDAWLEKLGQTALKIRPVAPVSRYALSKKEKGVVDMLRAMPIPLDQLLEAGVGEPETVRNVVCSLLLSRQIEVGSSKDPVGLHEPAETPQSVPPPEARAAKRAITLSKPPVVPKDVGSGGEGASGGVASQRGAGRGTTGNQGRTTTGTAARKGTGPRKMGPGDIHAMRQTIEAHLASNPQNHYEMLGVEKDANTATIRSAFFQLARVWHPDRLPEELHDLKAEVTKTFAAMGEAHQMLSDDAQRTEYDSMLGSVPDDEQAQVAQILDAVNAFQRAEILVKKKDYKNALTEAQTAYEGDPSQGDHVALYAWLQGMERTSGFEDLIEMLDGAIEDNKNSVRALWYRGQLLKKSGKNLKAIKDFKSIVAIQPNHMDAQREIRVHTMRKRSGNQANTPGLFGVFGKKK